MTFVGLIEPLAVPPVWAMGKESADLEAYRASQAPKHPPANTHLKPGCVRYALFSTLHLAAAYSCLGAPCAQMADGFQQWLPT